MPAHPGASAPPIGLDSTVAARPRTRLDELLERPPDELPALIRAAAMLRGQATSLTIRMAELEDRLQVVSRYPEPTPGPAAMAELRQGVSTPLGELLDEVLDTLANLERRIEVQTSRLEV